MARKLQVEIHGDASSLERALGRSVAATDAFGSSVAGKAGRGMLFAAKAAAVASLAIGGGRVLAGKAAIDSANAHAVALADTVQALETTHQVAGVTAEQITGLADAIE